MNAFDASHPVFDGHFPGNPLVPGAYLLAIVMREARARLQSSGREPVGVRTVKFLQPLRPGQPFECEFDTPDDRACCFTIRSQVGRIAAGVLTLAAGGTAVPSLGDPHGPRA